MGIDPKKCTGSLCAGERWARMGSSMVISGRPPFLDGETQVFGHPTDDGVGDDREAPGLFGLMLVMMSGHLPELGEVRSRRRACMDSPLLSWRPILRR
jgi:hypothetical protein